MKFSDEALMAYADGELDAETRRAIEAAMRSDPGIAERVARHRALRADLGAAFGGVLDEPIPVRLLDTATAAPAQSGPADLAAARQAMQEKQVRRRRWAWPEWTALAASLLLGVFIGRMALRAPEAELLATSDGQIVAAGSLASALTNQTGGAQPETSNVVIAATFRSTSGDYCRAFTSAAPEVIAGLACHEAGEWRVHTLTQGGAQPSGEKYRMAGTALPPALIQAIDSMIEGEALDLQQEIEARERGWRD